MVVLVARGGFRVVVVVVGEGFQGEGVVGWVVRVVVLWLVGFYVLHPLTLVLFLFFYV